MQASMAGQSARKTCPTALVRMVARPGGDRDIGQSAPGAFSDGNHGSRKPNPMAGRRASQPRQAGPQRKECAFGKHAGARLYQGSELR
jgi:hypothetical protein